MQENLGHILNELRLRAVKLRLKGLAILQVLETPIRGFSDRIAEASVSSQRAVTVSLVTAAHLIFLLALLRGLVPAMQKPPHEIILTVSGVFASKPEPPRAIPVRDVSKDLVPVPPAIAVLDAPAIDVKASIQPSGTPDVSMPSQAIASAHAFPPLPASVHAAQPMTVRLVLSIAEDGAVREAQVVSSSGMQALDDLAVQWVKERWRYRPAFRAGQAIGDTTTAIVVFLAASN